MAERDKPKQLIQTTLSIEDSRAKERGLRPLLAAAERFKINDCPILTGGQRTELSAGRLKIKVRPIWSWLLDKKA